MAFTLVVYSRGGSDGGIFVQKVPALRRLIEGEPLAAFSKGLEPAPDDVIESKNDASAFFGTSLASTLTARGIDTVILAGVSTSGCVQASVADRRSGLHEANLFDINAKYGDVVDIAAALSYLQGLRVDASKG